MSTATVLWLASLVLAELAACPAVARACGRGAAEAGGRYGDGAFFAALATVEVAVAVVRGVSVSSTRVDDSSSTRAEGRSSLVQ